jgi:hypothetical protein
MTVPQLPDPEFTHAMARSPAEQIAEYLRSGEHDSSFAAWPGENFLACAANAHSALRGALLATVHARTAHANEPPSLAGLDVTTLTRAKVTPMVQALFPRDEQAAVLELLARSVVFLTPAAVDAVIGEARWLGTAWDLANLYLASCDAELLSDDAPTILGLSEETTCFVSMDYFRGNERFDDFVVHETAHIFHNCKRETIGLTETRTNEWLLPIDYRKRETFAYACESYSRILELGRSRRQREALLAELEQGPLPADSKVDHEEYVDILHEAIAARNGFKRILRRCAPRRKESAK